jgi:hypothetical protein
MCLSLFTSAIRYRQFTGTKITISSHNEPLPNQVADPETEAANRPRVPVPLGRAYHLSNTCTRTHNPTTHTCKSTSVALQQSKTATESICTNTELGGHRAVHLPQRMSPSRPQPCTLGIIGSSRSTRRGDNPDDSSHTTRHIAEHLT